MAAYFLVVGVLIPHFAGGRAFQYWTYTQIGSDLPDAAGNVLARPWLPFEVALDDGQKVRTMIGMLFPFLALPLLSRISILAIPLVAERMLSTNALLWGTFLHYTLPLAPILAMGAALGAQLRRTLPGYRLVWQRGGWLVLRRGTGPPPRLTCRALSARAAAATGAAGDPRATGRVLCARG